MVIRDGDWELVRYDPALKRTTWKRVDGDVVTYRTDYEVTDVVEANTIARNDAAPGWKGDWHRIASIPVAFYWEKLHEAWLQGDNAYVNRILNDGDYRAFRTKSGTL